MKQYRIDHKERIAKLSKIRYDRWINKNKKYNPNYVKNYIKNCMKKYCVEKKKWKKCNVEKMRKYRNKWNKNNPGYYGLYRKNRYKTNCKFNLNNKMRRMIGLSLKGNKAGRHWESLVGYTLNDLIKRLKKTMPEGYIWNDYLNGKLHIDHIIPIAVFHFDKAENPDFQKCWSLKNLRLLPAKENISKGAKIDKPFQPALKLFLKL